MIRPAPVTAAMAAARRDSLNEGSFFKETVLLLPSTADYSSLHQINTQYFSITFQLLSHYFVLQLHYFSLILQNSFITTYYIVNMHALLHHYYLAVVITSYYYL